MGLQFLILRLGIEILDFILNRNSGLNFEISGCKSWVILGDGIGIKFFGFRGSGSVFWILDGNLDFRIQNLDDGSRILNNL